MARRSLVDVLEPVLGRLVLWVTSKTDDSKAELEDELALADLNLEACEQEWAFAESNAKRIAAKKMAAAKRARMNVQARIARFEKDQAEADALLSVGVAELGAMLVEEKARMAACEARDAEYNRVQSTIPPFPHPARECVAACQKAGGRFEQAPRPEYPDPEPVGADYGYLHVGDLAAPAQPNIPGI